ncbi:sodium:calcium antiporter [Pseudogulbenkiania sp. MAI-1]|uniref:sodium:calcium antiporter n=1 Tax=Pseudogulbenkiania sp. MAI-1 TaxID=990370 RepID=UPI00045E7F82|nr:cation transporter [Pseudogulbenkiania sp. MAI-1]
MTTPDVYNVTTISLLLWMQFFVCAAVIGFAGARLSRYGDVIAKKTGLGGRWIGLILLATVTSLPELATGISAVAIVKAPDLAVGDALGSCVFNLAMLAVLDVLYRGKSIYTVVGQGHILSAAFGIMLIGFVGFCLLLPDKFAAWSLGHVGLYSPLFVLMYLLAIRAVFSFERRTMAVFVGDLAQQYPDIALRQAVIRYLVAASAVVGAGIWLPSIGQQLAHLHGWHASFVGTLFIAGATSLPELAVTISALRLGALEMALANLLGSNLFDVLVLAVDDLFYLPGPILAHVSPFHATSSLSALIMTGAVIIGLIYRAQSRLKGVIGWVSLVLIAIYLANTFLLSQVDQASH